MKELELCDKWVLDHLEMAIQFQNDYLDFGSKKDRRLAIQELSFAISEVTAVWHDSSISNGEYFTIVKILTGCIDRFYEEAFMRMVL